MAATTQRYHTPILSDPTGSTAPSRPDLIALYLSMAPDSQARFLLRYGQGLLREHDSLWSLEFVAALDRLSRFLGWSR